ncbi:hypothetical protein CRUP_032309 [Coryphaenoides rupestris]|nr:hypothetical protein CRUP_032309 [Coryphaenoides rupestris]
MELQRPPVAVTCRLLLLLLLLCLLLTLGTSSPDPDQRQRFIEFEASKRIGGHSHLSPEERQLDDRLRELMREEVARADLPPAMHFFKARPLIRSSPVYGLLRKMPKGIQWNAVGQPSNVHELMPMVDVEWLVKNVTYRPHCYICPHCSPWTLLEQLRAKMVNVTDLDNSLMSNMTLWTQEDPEVAYPSQDVVWKRFEQAFLATAGLVTYAPVFRDYHHEGLSQFYRDNVMYVEVRALLPETYELDGSTHDRPWAMKTYQDVSRQFVEEHPDFLGARIIFAVHRVAVVRNTGRPLWYFREALSIPADQGFYLKYYFHAGETDLTVAHRPPRHPKTINPAQPPHPSARLCSPAANPFVKTNAKKLDMWPSRCAPISNQPIVGVVQLPPLQPGHAALLSLQQQGGASRGQTLPPLLLVLLLPRLLGPLQRKTTQVFAHPSNSLNVVEDTQ